MVEVELPTMLNTATNKDAKTVGFAACLAAQYLRSYETNT